MSQSLLGVLAGTLCIATPHTSPGAIWHFQEIEGEGRASRRLDEFVRAFGQDADRELYVLSSGWRGPTGSTGKAFRIVSGSMGGGVHAH